MRYTTGARFAAGILVLVLSILLLFQLVLGNPTGASITYNATDYGPTSSATSFTSNRSTIATLVLDAIQQDQYWKAYVGNVTGSLTLDDSSSNTIYDWTGITNPTGEVYASRNGSVDWNSIQCAQPATIATEQAVVNMTTGADNITNTFNGSSHTPTIVAGNSYNTCPMTALFRNNVRQSQNPSADWQEFLLESGTSLIYTAIINDNTQGFDGARTFDFQMIVAESDRNANPYTYYFYVELG